MTANKTNLDLVNINAYTKLCVLYLLVLKILNGNAILMLIKGHYSVTNLRKMTGNNPNLDLANMNVYTKFSQNLHICSKDIER